MYILSNGVKISEKAHMRLCRAMKDVSKKHVYFLEMETGRLMRVPRIYRRKLVALQKEPQRFLLLPKVSEDDRRKRFVAFVEEQRRLRTGLPNLLCQLKMIRITGLMMIVQYVNLRGKWKKKIATLPQMK